MEIWKDIPDYVGYYQVSNLGRVKSLARLDSIGRRIGGHLLKPGTRKGYYVINLFKLGKVKRYSIHVLVAIAFLDHKPNGIKIQVSHRDGYKLNNQVDNLQILTAREHIHYDINKSKMSSRYIGVSWHKSRSIWVARISINGKRKHLGNFKDELEAHKVYQAKLLEIQNGS